MYAIVYNHLTYCGSGS